MHNVNKVNSLLQRLSAHLREGQESTEHGEIPAGDITRLARGDKQEKATLIRKLRSFRGRLPEDFVFNREEAHQRGDKQSLC